jgi:hypothetical protein
MAGNFDGDGKLDIITAPAPPSYNGDSRYFIWRGGGRTDNSSPLVYAPAMGFYCLGAAVIGSGDIDGDGKDDALDWDGDVGLIAPTTCPGPVFQERMTTTEACVFSSALPAPLPETKTCSIRQVGHNSGLRCHGALRCR